MTKKGEHVPGERDLHTPSAYHTFGAGTDMYAAGFYFYIVAIVAAAQANKLNIPDGKVDRENVDRYIRYVLAPGAAFDWASFSGQPYVDSSAKYETDKQADAELDCILALTTSPKSN